MLGSLAAFLRSACADEPLLLILDDIEVADTDALLALEYVSRELRDAPVLGLATYKEHAIRLRPDAEAIVGGLARTCRRIDLVGVPDTDLAVLLEQVTAAAIGGGSTSPQPTPEQELRSDPHGQKAFR